MLTLFSFQGMILKRVDIKFTPIVGVDGGEGTPVPIPNTAVKLTCADNTWLVAAREDRKMPTQRKALVFTGAFFVVLHLPLASVVTPLTLLALMRGNSDSSPAYTPSFRTDENAHRNGLRPMMPLTLWLGAFLWCL